MARHELWVELADRPGNLAALAGDLAACGANIVHLDVHAGPGATVIDRLVVQLPDARSDELTAVADRCGATLRRLDATDPPGGPDGAAGSQSPAVVQSPRRDASARSAHGGRHHRRPPMTLERLVALDDGGLVRLRHLSAGDRDAVVAHHGRCTDATRRHSRFLAPGALPSPSAGADVSLAGSHDRVALAALVGGDIVGVARYDRDGARRAARMAVIVEDRHQRRGIGTLLVSELAVLASNAEVGLLRAICPAGGDGLQQTLRRAGLAVTVRCDGGALVLDCVLRHALSASA